MADTLNQTSILYDVPGDVPVVAQPYSMGCWATVTTMMISWRDQVSYSFETAMDMLGSGFRQLFDAGMNDIGVNNSAGGLPPQRLEELAQAAGMVIEYQRCETPESILQLLQSYGPLRISDDEDLSANFARHARIITGIYGDGDAASTYLKIIDPDGGRTYDEPFERFAAKYESLADDARYKVQIMHY